MMARGAGYTHEILMGGPGRGEMHHPGPQVPWAGSGRKPAGVDMGVSTGAKSGFQDFPIKDNFHHNGSVIN